MPESLLERLRRLRPLVPNSVKDQVLKLRILDGWDDHRIVTADLVAVPLAPSFAQPLRRRARNR